MLLKSVLITTVVLCFVARIEGSQLESRDENKMWLVRHLEITRQLMIDDLKVVKVSLSLFPSLSVILRIDDLKVVKVSLSHFISLCYT